jgi:hypothetical protein
MSQGEQPIACEKDSSMEFPRAAVRRAHTRTALAPARDDPVKIVKVRAEEFQVPNSTSLLASIATGIPSQVL